MDTETPPPGTWCRILPGPQIEHVEPCPDGHRTGTITDAATGAVLRRPI